MYPDQLNDLIRNLYQQMAQTEELIIAYHRLIDGAYSFSGQYPSWDRYMHGAYPQFRDSMRALEEHHSKLSTFAKHLQQLLTKTPIQPPDNLED